MSTNDAHRAHTTRTHRGAGEEPVGARVLQRGLALGGHGAGGIPQHEHRRGVLALQDQLVSAGPLLTEAECPVLGAGTALVGGGEDEAEGSLRRVGVGVPIARHRVLLELVRRPAPRAEVQLEADCHTRDDDLVLLGALIGYNHYSRRLCLEAVAA